MKKGGQLLLCFFALGCMAVRCKMRKGDNALPLKDSSRVNLAHLNYLYTPVTFSIGPKAAGVFIYSEAPDYHIVTDTDEGFTCVDDVARAVQVYLRSDTFSSDTAAQSRAFALITFVLEMQSANGYFYNFLFPDSTINTTGITSVNKPGWWSWRSLYTLTEGTALVRNKNPQLADRMDNAAKKLASAIKTDLARLPKTTKTVSGIKVPEWLPAGSGTDQAAILILGLIPYCTTTQDTALVAYIKKLADGIVLMQQGDAGHFPYGAFLSWENTWHAYACDQAYALMKAGTFLNDAQYVTKALMEVDHFYPWLLQQGFLSSFEIAKQDNKITTVRQQKFDQIAYGIRPMVSAAAEAYRLTKQEKYADIAGHLAAWFLGANDANNAMYSVATGRGFDGIKSSSVINLNAGAESTIEALLALETAEQYPAIKMALNKYKR